MCTYEGKDAIRGNNTSVPQVDDLQLSPFRFRMKRINWAALAPSILMKGFHKRGRKSVGLSLPLCTSCVWWHDGAILPLADVLFNPFQHSWLSIEIVHGDIEKALCKELPIQISMLLQTILSCSWIRMQIKTTGTLKKCWFSEEQCSPVSGMHGGPWWWYGQLQILTTC